MGKDKDVLDQLDQTINAIESHRDWRAQKRAEEARALDEAWDEVLAAAHKLRSKLQGNPKLRYFSIARDNSQVAISFHARGASANLLSLYRQHPEGKFPATQAIWCREPGRDDSRFDNGADAVEKMVRHCAGNLTAAD